MAAGERLEVLTLGAGARHELTFELGRASEGADARQGTAGAGAGAGAGSSASATGAERIDVQAGAPHGDR
jgi:hypothetical protein